MSSQRNFWWHLGAYILLFVSCNFQFVPCIFVQPVSDLRPSIDKVKLQRFSYDVHIKVGVLRQAYQPPTSMTHVPLATLEKPQLLKETSLLPAIVITGSVQRRDFTTAQEQRFGAFQKGRAHAYRKRETISFIRV